MVDQGLELLFSMLRSGGDRLSPAVCSVRNLTSRFQKRHYILLMLMEDAMNLEVGKLIQAFDGICRTLHMLVVNLPATIFSLPTVWYFAATAYTVPGLAA